jgi:hypothetical protein
MIPASDSYKVRKAKLRISNKDLMHDFKNKNMKCVPTTGSAKISN